MPLTSLEKDILIQTSRLFWLFHRDPRENLREKIKTLFSNSPSPEFRDQLFQHRLNNLFFHYSQGLLPPKYIDLFKNDYLNQGMINSLFLLEFESLIKKIPDSIPVIPLKGIAFIFNNYIYPEPGLRIMEDIDLLVNEKDYDVILNILFENNYYIPEQYRNLRSKHFHYLLKKKLGRNIITLELHFALSNKKRFQVDSESFFSSSAPLFPEHPNILYPSVNDLVYYLIFHAGFHYIFERLQWLGEIEGIVHKFNSEIDFNYIISRAEKENTSILVFNTLAALCSLYKIDLPDSVMKIISKKKDKFLSDNQHVWNREIFRSRLFQYKFGLKSMDTISNKILWSSEKIKNHFKN